jgi:galactitol PTS system EIIA component
MSISRLLHTKAVLVRIKAEDSREVIQRLGNLLKDLGFVGEHFVEATLAREASMPTGLPLGGKYNAAIPHVDIEYVNHPALAVATLENPVNFKNMGTPQEDVPVQLVIMLALDQPKSQIETLQEVASILQDSHLVEELVSAKDVEAVFSLLS